LNEAIVSESNFAPKPYDLENFRSASGAFATVPPRPTTPLRAVLDVSAMDKTMTLHNFYSIPAALIKRIRFPRSGELAHTASLKTITAHSLRRFWKRRKTNGARIGEERRHARRDTKIGDYYASCMMSGH